MKVNSINSWIMHAQVASRYGNIAVDVDSNSNNNSHITSRKRYRPTSHGNVFLVGDAAHRFPPSGGFGMNTGIQDAHNLAWKLALVCQGRARPEILSQTYDQGIPNFLCLYIVYSSAI